MAISKAWWVTCSVWLLKKQGGADKRGRGADDARSQDGGGVRMNDEELLKVVADDGVRGRD